MSGLALVAGMAAQAAAQTGAPPPQTAQDAGSASATHIGQSTYVDLEAGAGYSTNPLLQFNSKGEAFGRLSARAVHTRVSARATTVLSGFVQGMFYSGNYGTQESFDVNGRHDAAVSETLRLYVDADAAYDKGGQLDQQILTVPGVPLLTGTIVPPPFLGRAGDFLTVTGRTFRLRADVGGQLSVSARDNVDFSAGLERDTIKSAGFDTRYTTVPLSLGYDRQLNEHTSVGARVVAVSTHYGASLSTSVANSQVITPELTAQLHLSPRLLFTGDVGASFASTRGPGYSHHSTGLAGDATLCSSGERTTFCGRVSVQQQAATAAGPTHVMSAGLDYSRQLTADDTLQLSLGADHYSNPLIIVSGRSFSRGTYARAVVNYSRKFRDRLYGGVNLSARKLVQAGPEPRADIAASFFIRYRLGDVR